jgi:hypothetical protein
MFPDFPDKLRNSIPIAVASRLVKKLYVTHCFRLFSLLILALEVWKESNLLAWLTLILLRTVPGKVAQRGPDNEWHDMLAWT